MATPGDAIQIEVDLRRCWTQVRDQGTRNSCLACATSDVHMMAHNLTAPLSAEYLYCQASQRMPGRTGALGLTFDAVDDALRKDGQPCETEWPYQAVEPSPWTPPPVTQRWYAGLSVPTGVAIAMIAATLRAQRPVLLGIKLTAEWLGPRDAQKPIRGVGPGFGGHAVVAVGMGSDRSGQRTILIRNSWGASWGLGGYGWLEASYFNDKLMGFRLLDALAHH